MNVLEMDACKKCSMNCLLTHGRNGDLSPVVSSFFKVMIDDRFSEILFIPPRFARELTSLADKEIQIEDVSGRQWTAALSYVDGCLAFEQGWQAFSADHGIESGDIVLVHYNSGSHFLVQIYGKSGCEKLNFPAASHSVWKKKAKISRGFVDEDSSSCFNSGVNINIIQGCVEGSPEAHLGDSALEKHKERQYSEDPCCMINRDIDFAPMVDKRCLLDLSQFEMCKSIPVSGINSFLTQDDVRPHVAEREVQMNGSSREENLIDYEAFGTSMYVSSANELDEAYDSRKDDSLKHGEDSGQNSLKSCPSMTVVSANNNNMKHMGIPAELEAQTTTFGDQDPRRHTKGSEKLIKREQKDLNQKHLGEGVKILKKERKEFNPKGFGGIVKKIKKEHKEFNPKHFGMEQNASWGLEENRASIPDQVPKIVKGEPVCFTESPSLCAVTCLVTSDKDPFLELPTGLSSSTCRERVKLERKVVLLRDSSGRLWPVLYHEKTGLVRLRALTRGWQPFREANRIQNGDECVFVLENESEDIYGVEVVHK